MGLDSKSLLSRRIPIRTCNDRIGNTLQKPWHRQCRDSILHKLALSSLGNKTILESYGGPYKNQTLVDLQYATTS